MFLNLTELIKQTLSNKRNDITLKKRKEIEEAFKSATTRGLTMDDVLVFKEYHKETEYNEDALRELVRDIDLIKKPIDNRCYFIEGNLAWVSPDMKDGDKIKYFSKNPQTGEYFHADIIDIYIKMTDKSRGEAITELLGAYKYYTQEETRKENYRDMYRENIRMLKETDWERFPYLNKYINNHIEILERLYTTGLKHINGDAYVNIHNRPVFFTSSRYIGSDYKSGYRTVSSMITMFALLGFIHKESEEGIPENLLTKAKTIRNEVNYKQISFLSVEVIDEERLRMFEKRAMVLDDNGVVQRNLSCKLVEDRLGKDIADMVYPQNID